MTQAQMPLVYTCRCGAFWSRDTPLSWWHHADRCWACQQAALRERITRVLAAWGHPA